MMVDCFFVFLEDKVGYVLGFIKVCVIMFQINICSGCVVVILSCDYVGIVCGLFVFCYCFCVEDIRV